MAAVGEWVPAAAADAAAVMAWTVAVGFKWRSWTNTKRQTTALEVSTTIWGTLGTSSKAGAQIIDKRMLCGLRARTT